MNKILFVAGLAVVLMSGNSQSFAQTGVQSVSTDTVMPVPSVTSVSSTAPVEKCGVNTFQANDQCDAKSFRGAYFQCYDGYEEKQSDNACKSSEEWQEYGKKICASRCAVVKPMPMPTPVPAPIPVPKPTQSNVPTVSNCYFNETLMREYDQLILQLRKAEATGDKRLAQEITEKIISLKQNIAKNQEECKAGVQPNVTPPTVSTSKPYIGVVANSCADVAAWKNKIAYYRKLAALSDEELKTQNLQSREEITQILKELEAGYQKVVSNCASVSAGSATSVSTLEPVKPVVVDSGVEIDSYYRQKLQQVMSVNDGAEKQIETLKTLRSEIDNLIEKMIAGKKEFRASEVSGLVSEMKILPGEIRVNDTSVKTTDKKVKVDLGAKELSVEPKEKEVTINDGKVSVKAAAVSIKDGALSVGSSEVKFSPSEVIDKLQLTPKSVELKEENSKAVYKIKMDEHRKLFGFIPITIEKSVNADAANGNVINETRPWWSFLSTK